MAQRMPNRMYIVCSRFQLEQNKYYMTCTLCISHILKYWLSPSIFTNCSFNWLEIIFWNLIVCRSACIVTYLLYIFNCRLRSMFSFVGVNLKNIEPSSVTVFRVQKYSWNVCVLTANKINSNNCLQYTGN